MKDGFLSSGAFWGILLIVGGVLALLRSIFHINLPVFRILIALFFIYIGVSILTGGFGRAGGRNTVIFGEMNIIADATSREYSIILGSGVVDLTRITPAEVPDVEVSVVFGNGTVRINPEIPMRIRASSAFGNARLPNGNAVFFGEQTYTTKGLAEGGRRIELKANAVFGSVQVIESAG